MTIFYSIIFLAATIGIVSLIMSYDELNKLGLFVAAFPVLVAIGIFAKWSISGGIIPDMVTYFETPEVAQSLPIWLGIILLVFVLTLFREGTVFWLWRRLHPQSAPTEHLNASEHGSGMAKKQQATASTLMGSATSMFKNSELDVRTIALIRLAFAVFSKTDRRTIIGVENFLRLGDGRKYRTYQHLVAEILDSKSSLKDIIHPYWRAINGNNATARIMFSDLCRLAKETENLDKKTVNNLMKAGRELGLSQEEIQRTL